MNIESSFEANVRAAEAGASPCRMAGRKKATAGSTAFAAGANGESRCNGPLGLLMSLASGRGTDSSSMRTGANGWARASFAGRAPHTERTRFVPAASAIAEYRDRSSLA
ncbi:hypothetical protein [Burkholderia pseudomallei]|uniref:hypothetical protein n=1 Tax=Burkholderia pseudomallei TaxID=28450 RepID=UPI00358F4739